MTEFFTLKKLFLSYLKMVFLFDKDASQKIIDFIKANLNSVIRIHVNSIQECPRNDWRIKVFIINSLWKLIWTSDTPQG